MDEEKLKKIAEVLIPFSSGEVFGQGLLLHQEATGKVLIPFSSGEVFGR